jgi:alcohol dehydrogenase class IV
MAATVAQAVSQMRNTGCDAVVGVGCDVSMAIAKATAAIGPSRFRAPDLLAGFVREDYVGLAKKPKIPFTIPRFVLVCMHAHTE